MQFLKTFACAGLLTVLALGAPVQADPFTIEEVANGLEHPWGMDFLPDGRILVTEREGNLRIVAKGQLSEPVAGLPDIWVSGQGGLLDVMVDSAFADSRRIFLSYSEPGDGGAHTAVASATLSGNSLENLQVIFRQYPTQSGGRHFGSRIVEINDGTLLVTLGDRGEREESQNPENLIGKVVRINKDGSVPSDNPFIGQAGFAPEIYSIGHRNPQGAALDGEGVYWTQSHGARGGDEINRPEAGKNYGWPVISYGRHYSGFKIGEGTTKDGMEQPLFYWDPSIAPSGMTFYSGEMFPDWQGDIFVGGLRAQSLVRVEVENGQITGSEERYLEDRLGRIRDVRTGPDGALWVLTDDDPGALYRLTPG